MMMGNAAHMDDNRERILLEKLTQAASKYVHGKSGEPLAGQSLEEARRKLIVCVDEAYDYLQGPKTDD